MQMRASYHRSWFKRLGGVSGTLLIAMLATATVKAQGVHFTAQDLHDNWQPKHFVGQTRYTLNKGVLRAQPDAAGSASGLFYKQKIDLSKTPYLRVRWKIDMPYRRIDELTKAGDDFAVRVYAIDKRGLFGLTSKAIGYVYASAQNKGTHWANPFAAQIAMVAASSARSERAGRWHNICRNLVADFKQTHRIEVAHIDALALMSDNDNHRGQSTGYYAHISMSASPCTHSNPTKSRR